MIAPEIAELLNSAVSTYGTVLVPRSSFRFRFKKVQGHDDEIRHGRFEELSNNNDVPCRAEFVSSAAVPTPLVGSVIHHTIVVYSPLRAMEKDLRPDAWRFSNGCFGTIRPFFSAEDWKSGQPY